MKICERCGHPNWEIIKLEHGGKMLPSCSKCKRVFDQPAQCQPMLGHERTEKPVGDDEKGQSVGDGCYVIGAIGGPGSGS